MFPQGFEKKGSIFPFTHPQTNPFLPSGSVCVYFLYQRKIEKKIFLKKADRRVLMICIFHDEIIFHPGCIVHGSVGGACINDYSLIHL